MQGTPPEKLQPALLDALAPAARSGVPAVVLALIVAAQVGGGGGAPSAVVGVWAVRSRNQIGVDTRDQRSGTYDWLIRHEGGAVSFRFALVAAGSVVTCRRGAR